MNKDILEGKWKQMKGEAKKKWERLTNDDLDYAEGNRDKLVGALQERYGHTKDTAEKEVDTFFERQQANR